MGWTNLTLIKNRDILNEIIYFLRNNLTDPNSRGTDDIANFTATAGQTNFDITAKVFNISSITVNGVSKSLGTDYTLSFTATTCTVIFNSGLTLNDAVIVNYHYGSSWVKLIKRGSEHKINDYPFIAVKSIADSSSVLGINLEGLSTDFSFRIIIAYESYSKCIEMMHTIKQLMWDNNKNFYYVTGVIPVGSAGPGLDPSRKEEIHMADIDYLAPLQLQN